MNNSKLLVVILFMTIKMSAQVKSLEQKIDTTFYKFKNGFIITCGRDEAEGFNLSESKNSDNKVIKIYYLQTENLMAEYEISHKKIRNLTNSIRANIILKNGKYEEWYISGEKRLSCFYSNNELNGEFRVFYRNGIVKRMELWKNGKWQDGECYDENGNKTEYCSYQEIAEFVGGLPKLYKYIGQNLTYPEYAQRKGIHGKVYLSFVVDTDGSVIDIEVVKGVEKHLDDEAIRIVSEMPKWKPAKFEGNFVKSEFTLPINFSF